MAFFGQEVKRLREEAGLTQAELATLAGVTPGYVSHLEKGIREGKIDVLFSLCRALGVGCTHFEQFFPQADTPPQTPAPPAKGKK